MAKKKSESRSGGIGPEKISPEERHFNGGDIQSSRSMDGDSFEKGYPGVIQEHMHINQGRGSSKLLRK